MTLAKHLGTDAKHAQLILNQAQDGISEKPMEQKGMSLKNVSIIQCALKMVPRWPALWVALF